MVRITNIAARLKEYREGKNLSLNEMERLTGIPAQTLNRYELDQRSPKYDTAIQIAEALSVNPLWLYGYDVSETEKLPIPETEDGQEKKAMELFNSLSDDRKGKAISYLQFLVEQKDM